MDSNIKFYLENKVELDLEIKRLVPEFEAILKEGGIQALVGSVYNLIDRMNEQTEVDKVTTCSSGCSFCCYEKIAVTSFEGSLIASWVKHYDLPVNEKVLKMQQSKKFHKLKYADKRCSLLNEKNECSIYEVRPLICRLWNSMSEPKLCDARAGYNKTRTARTVQGHAVMLALQFLDKKEDASNNSYSLYDCLGKL